jgi:Cu2+-exporting ATPase
MDHNKEHNKHQHQEHEKHDHAGHDHGAMIADFRRRFWISLALSVPVLVLSPMIQQFLGYTIEFAGRDYMTAAISTVIFFYGGWPFLTGLVDELQDRNPGMMTLIALAIVVAWSYSTATVFGVEGKPFFWELATLIVVMLLGHWIEMRSVASASRSLELLAKMMPAEAHLLEGDETRDVPIKELEVGDIVLVRANEKIPVDGTITEGESYLDESMLTGESKPVKKSKNDEVIGGSINGKNSIKVKVEKTGKDSYLNKVINLVEEAQESKSKTQNLANRAARWLTFIAIGAGAITLTTWLLLGKDFNFALSRMVTVMVISCPHALGLAIPLVVAISTAVSAQNGLLIRNRTAFENARKITALIFDKTGTLTEGDFGVSRVETVSDTDENTMLHWAASLEQNSEHPIGAGIVAEAKERELDLLAVESFESITGKGIKGEIAGEEMLVVSPGYLEENDFDIPAEAKSDAAETVVFVIKSGELIGFIGLADEIRAESADAIQTLREQDIKIYMATGDNEQTAKAVSDKLDLDGYYAEVLPHEKQEIIKDLQAKDEYVAMTGDGVNDAPALAQADIGIAVGSGTDVAAETADIILVESNPKDIANLILFGRKTYGKMIQNLVWATAYNVIAIPLAAGILYPTFMLNPAVGAVLMSLSTVIVAVNAQLLRTSLKS